MINTAHVVGEVAVHEKGGLYRPLAHDSFLDSLHGRISSHHRGKCVLVSFVVVVRSNRSGVARGFAMSRSLARAAWCTLRRIRVVTLRAMVVAVWHRERFAHPFPERASTIVLPARDNTTGLDIAPWGKQVAAVAPVRGSTETDVLGRQRDNNAAACGNAQTIRCGFCSSKSPAATTVALISNICDGFCTLWPLCGRIEFIRDRNTTVVLDMEFALSNGLFHYSFVLLNIYTQKRLGCIAGQTSET
mmetsp:Transcript_18281/g.25688  ORF Transcript_18281/g.25688 Transcript_18281/m.25688 type:complete len:246 (+) Transcript_18281:523-1260(+)